MKSVRFVMLSVMFFLISVPVFAQGRRGDGPDSFSRSGRLADLSNRLVAEAENFSEAAYNNYSNKNNNDRSDVEVLILAQHFDASASLFRRLVQDRRRRSELRDIAQNLSDMMRQSERYGARERSDWNNTRRTLDDILSELNVNNGGGRDNDGYDGGGRGNDGGGGRDNRNSTGRVRWRGTVDDRVNLVIRASNIEIRTLGGAAFNDGTYDFSSPLPRRQVNVSVNKIEGRGEVRVIQQPSFSNDFIAVVEIYDNKGGARNYEIEISW